MEKFLLLMLRGVAALPLGLLYVLSDFIYILVYYVVGYRKKVVRRNLSEAFPDKSSRELRRIEREYYHFLADMIVETVKLLQISEAEMRRRVEIVNPEVVAKAAGEGCSVALLLGHYANWEWVQEISRCFPDSIYKASIYRPLNSATWNSIYHRIRSRWAVNLLPQKESVKALLRSDHRPWACGFIADARPRHTNEHDEIVFLNHHTSFIYGPEVLGRKVGARFFFLSIDRQSRGYYRIEFTEISAAQETGNYPVMREFWRLFEARIKEKPAYWLWSHKRWKYDSVVKS